jgi:hypothetical protein
MTSRRSALALALLTCATELSVTTFGTFLREFSPLWSHPMGHPACQGIPLGALACTVVDSGFQLPFFRRVAGHGRKLATDDLTRRFSSACI